MAEIFKKEMRAYFSSPMGYVILAIFACISSLYFVFYNLAGLTANMKYVFQFQAMWLVGFTLPMLTMRLLTEERKLKTDQMLLTSPVSIPNIVLGKFFSALAMFIICISINIVFFIITMSLGGSVMLKEFTCYFIGIILLAAALISIDLFISSLTENQLISAFSAIGVNILFLLLQSFVERITNSIFYFFASLLSVYTHFFNDFANGIISVTGIIYYLSFSAVFLFFIVRVIEKRRWS